MEKLLIFTNSLSIGNVDDEIEKKVVGIENISIKTPIQKFENGVLLPVSTLQEGEIFFVIDSMTREDYDKFLTTRKQDQLLYILYHIKGGKFNIDFTSKKEFEFPEIGQHIKDGGSKYREVTQILTDNQNDKKRRIIDLIFKRHNKLNVALEFLHECLVKKPTGLSQLTDFDTETRCITVEEDGKEVKKNLEELRKSLKENPPDDIASFESLRNGVLKMAGV